MCALAQLTCNLDRHRTCCLADGKQITLDVCSGRKQLALLPGILDMLPGRLPGALTLKIVERMITERHTHRHKKSEGHKARALRLLAGHVLDDVRVTGVRDGKDSDAVEAAARRAKVHIVCTPTTLVSIQFALYLAMH